jgi:tripartite-type tricarboxylate transporter receptor subunit TctC
VTISRIRSALGLAVAAAWLAAGSAAAQAQDYPKGPVRLVVTTGVGASPDVVARTVAEGLSRLWKQQVFVTNHPGAAGSIGMRVAGSAPADGYTLMHALSSSFVALPEIAKTFPYDLVRDFVSIGFISEVPMGFVVPASLGVNTLGEFIDYAKKRPGQVNVAVLSRGGMTHLVAEWIRSEAKIEFASVHYPGAPGALSDLMGGRVEAFVDGLPSLMGPIAGGKVKLIAVGSEKRLPNLPDTPTFSETLPTLKRAAGWFALMAPPGTPPAIAEKVSGDLRKVLSERDIQEKFLGMASYTRPMSPKELLAFVREEQNMWRPVIEQIGLRGK